MDIILDVVDSMSNTPLPGATISVNGSAVGQTDSNGVYDLSCDESDQITVSYVGYSPYKIAAGIIEGSAQIQLARSTDTLPTVTVTPSPKTSGLLPLAILGGAVILLSGSGKKSVGATKKQKTGLLIGAGALGLGAVYLISKKSAPTLPVSTVPLTTSQMVANKAGVSSNPLSALTSLFPSLSNLFGGSSAPAPGSPGSFTPVGIDESSYSDQQPIAPITATDPGSGMTLDFSGAPGMNGIGARYTGQKFAGIGTGARYNLPKVRELKSNIGDIVTIPTLAIGAIGAMLLFSKKKSKIGDSDFSSYILPLGIVGGGAYLLYKTGLFGNSANAQNNDQTASGTASSIQAAIAAEIAAGGFATYTAANFQSFANDIYNNLQSGSPNQDQVVRDCIQANTLLDWLYIKQAFGTKSFNTGSWLSLCALAQMNCTTLDLDAALKASLDSAHINTINNYFSSQGINYTL